MFTSIDTENFQSEIIAEKNPVFLACIRRDHELREQLVLLEEISQAYRGLKICLLHEDFSEIYRALHIEGTPTFLILSDNEEKGRLLGKVDADILSAFIGKTLRQLNPKRSVEFS